MTNDKIKLPLGDMTVCAANLDNAGCTGEALARCEHGKGWVRGTRADLVEILYYVEACPAFWGDGQEPTEVSAVRRTARNWRAKLGIGEREKVPTPASAERPAFPPASAS